MKPEPLAIIDQQGISIRDMGDLLVRVGGSLERREGFTLFTLNLDHLVKRRQSRAFREIYSRASFVTADGWPVVSLARSQAPGLQRTSGADLVVPLCRLAAARAVPVALFGSSDAILEKAAARLRDLCPGLSIVLCEAPPYGFDPEGMAGPEAMARIAASGARICFVALGAPKQEMFSDCAFAANPEIGYVCIGAALDFLAGAHRRAPVALQKLGFEWAWRLALQPRRLGLRYLRCALLYARLVTRREPALPIMTAQPGS